MLLRGSAVTKMVRGLTGKADDESAPAGGLSTEGLPAGAVVDVLAGHSR
ncbi:MAG: hypothetical protein U0P48_05260 [Ancrocorticia sp.]